MPGMSATFPSSRRIADALAVLKAGVGAAGVTS